MGTETAAPSFVLPKPPTYMIDFSHITPGSVPMQVTR